MIENDVIAFIFEFFRYGVLPDSLKPTGKVKSSIKREDSSSEEENDSEQKVMEEVKRYIAKFLFSNIEKEKNKNN